MKDKKITCYEHKSYKGLKPPIESNCKECWIIFIAKNKKRAARFLVDLLVKEDSAVIKSYRGDELFKSFKNICTNGIIKEINSYSIENIADIFVAYFEKLSDLYTD